jgi:hypothetical protein
MNPVSHVNNMVSNLTMAHLAGVSYLRADKYIGAARDFATNAPGIQHRQRRRRRPAAPGNRRADAPGVGDGTACLKGPLNPAITSKRW